MLKKEMMVLSYTDREQGINLHRNGGFQPVCDCPFTPLQCGAS